MMSAALTDKMMRYFSSEDTIDDRSREAVIRSCEKLYTRFSTSKKIVVRTRLGRAFRAYHMYNRHQLILYLAAPSLTALSSESVTRALIVDTVMETRSKYYFASLILLTIAFILLTNFIVPSPSLLIAFLIIGLGLLAIAYLIAKRAPKHTVIHHIEEVHRELIDTSSKYRYMFSRLQSIVSDVLKVVGDTALRRRSRGYIVVDGCGLYEFRSQQREDNVFDIDMWRVSAEP